MRLKIGLSASDRTRPIADGEVPIAGVEADITLMPVQPLFNKQLTEHVFDCCEFPIATYLRTLEDPARPYVGIPIFPSRHFRLSSVFVNRASGIAKPADLAGKRIGISVFDMAAAVWLRGIFADHFDLPRTSPIYVTGGLEQARSGDEHPQFYPDRFRIEHRTDASLAQLLARGEIDALYTARAPSTWPSPQVARLFEPPMEAERRYFETTRIFPAMHLVAMKRHVAEADPGLPQALFAAFSKAEEIARTRLDDQAALSTMLPWQLEHLLEAERYLGRGYWAGGFARNRHMLTTIIRYTAEDGLIAAPMAPEALFPDAAMLAT